MTASRHLEPVNDEQAEKLRISDRVDQQVKSGSWLDSQQFPDLEWIVPGVLSEGYGILVGAPKAGKSFLVAEIGLAAACGHPALGAISIEQRPVLYFALEDGHRRLQSRFKSIMQDAVIPDDMYTAITATSLGDLLDMAEEQQNRFIEADKRPPLIIVDTLGRVNPGTRNGQDAYTADYQLGARLQRLAHRVPGSAVLAVHHTNKGEHADFLNAVSGTQGVTGACDSVLVLSRARKSDDAILAITGRDHEKETEVAIHRQRARWLLKGSSFADAEDAAQEVKQQQMEAAIDAKYGDRSKQILDEFKTLESTQFLTPKDVADAVGMDNDTAGKYLRRLLKQGLIAKAGRGSYKAVSDQSELS